jgi:trimeric autotransporter adhesin
MKTTTTLIVFLFACVIADAQNVGIGTIAPHPSAQLDITASAKGLLIPRMNTSAISSIPNPVKGLLVYDSAKNQMMVNMGSSASPEWQTIVFKSGWNLNGNSNTNPATDFIGTTDSIPFIIKAFNQKAGRIEVSSLSGSTFFGYKAGNFNTGNSNTAMGLHAFRSNTTGTQNTAIGNEALSNNISGSVNVANGYYALFSNISGSQNTGIGYQALVANTAGNNNTAVGSLTLTNNQTGYSNVAIGAQALRFSSDKSNLVAIGDSALYNNGQSSPLPWQATANTAIGSKALFLNSYGSDLTATGYNSLYNNTSGVANAAYGSLSLQFNTTGSANTAFGFSSLEINQTGSYNTGIGTQVLRFNKASQYNTAVGYQAANSYDIGWNNTIIGADADVSFNGQYNSIAIGNIATCPDNSTVRIGNSANWSYGGYANWTNISDERFKKNITENVKGLDFIMKLRPVTYQLNVADLSKKLNEFSNSRPNESMKKAMAEKEQMWWTGFLAQDVEAAAKQSGFEFSGVDKPRNTDGLYGLRYAEFVVPLVKAVQEQQMKIEQLEKQNELLLKRLEILENKNKSL